MAIANRSFTPPHPGDIRRELGLSREKMAYIMSVSAKTIENWERLGQSPSDGEKRARLAAIEELVRLGVLVYGTEGLPVFVQTPLRVLNNQTPLQEIMAGHIERVTEVLAAEYEGLGA